MFVDFGSKFVQLQTELCAFVRICHMLANNISAKCTLIDLILYKILYCR